MRPVELVIAPVVDADGIAVSQTTGAAGDLTLDGVFVNAQTGIAELPASQKVDLTSGGNLSGVNFTIIGDYSGFPISETIAGPNIGTVTTTNYFTNVKQITTDAAVGSAVEVGSNADSTSALIPVNQRDRNFKLTEYVIITGTITYTVQNTGCDIFNDEPSTIDWFDDDILAGLSANENARILSPFIALRLKVDSFTAGATAKFKVIMS